MRKLAVFTLVIFLVFWFFYQSCKQKSREASKPNVILIMTDDQGYGDLACHGNPYIEVDPDGAQGAPTIAEWQLYSPE